MSPINMYMDGNAALDLSCDTRPAFTVIRGGRQAVPAPQRAKRPSIAAVLAAIAVFLMFVVFVAVGSSAMGAQDVALQDAIASADRMEVRVQPGDSLWSLAQEHAVDGLTSEQTSDLIASWNGLDGAMLQPGDTLLVPAA